MVKLNSKFKWLLLLYLLLSDVIFARGPLPPGPQNNPRSVASKSSVSESQNQSESLGIKWAEKPIDDNVESPEVFKEGGDLDHAHQLVLDISASLQGQLHLHRNASCADLATEAWRGNSFSQELLGLAMVPVLVSAGCLFEAQGLIMKLYTILGKEDTRVFSHDILILFKRGKEKESTNIAHHTYNASHTRSHLTIQSQESQHHLQALMFNINQLAKLEKSADSYKNEAGPKEQCKGWVRVKGTQLLGRAAEQSRQLRLDGAQMACRRLGPHCAGVTQDDSSGYYHVILRPGSRVVPSSSLESWIQNCRTASVRWRRNTVSQNHCVNKKEEQVYTVVEWIPAVSTLYNLGTAVYYASVNCYDTAKERAILSTVDLGTDALMAVTGGTAGVAGYALGAGFKSSVKAGVKYLLNNMKEEDDLLMNQNSWEDGTLNIQ